jgi:hypothetical protein
MVNMIFKKINRREIKCMRSNHIKRTRHKHSNGLSIAKIRNMIIYLIIGFILVSIGYKNTNTYDVYTIGTVVDYYYNDNNYSYSPIVQYVTSDDQTITSTYYTNNDTKEYSINESVNIYYSSKEPSNFKFSKTINNYKEIKWIGYFFLFIGIIKSLHLVFFLLKFAFIRIFFR